MTAITGTVSIKMVDAQGIVGNVIDFVEIDDTKTIAELVTDVIDLSNAEVALSQANELQTTVKIFAHVNPDPVPGSGDIEKGALFNFNNASDPYAQGVFIPDVNPSILNANGLVDLTNTDVTNFISFLTTAHTVITVVTKGVRALTSLKDALISFRKHRKPLSRKTKEL
jgi:hypothetical protein